MKLDGKIIKCSASELFVDDNLSIQYQIDDTYDGDVWDATGRRRRIIPEEKLKESLLELANKKASATQQKVKEQTEEWEDWEILKRAEKLYEKLERDLADFEKRDEEREALIQEEVKTLERELELEETLEELELEREYDIRRRRRRRRRLL